MLAQIQHQLVIVLEAELYGRLVAQPHQLLEVFLDDLADELARLPDGPAAGRVVRGLEHFPDLAVGQLLAVHLGAEHIKGLLDGVRLGDHLL